MDTPLINTGIQTAKYCNVAGLGVLIFDYFLTLEREVRWTWTRRWNISRVIFVISRYMPFAAAGMTSYAAIATRANEDCNNFSSASNAIHIISIVAAEGLLIIRTYAFWQYNKKFLAVLLVLASICIACAVSITQVANNPSSNSPTSDCTFQADRSSAIQYGFLVAYQLLLMSCMVFKRYRDYRDSDSRLVKVIFKGAMRYMTAMIFVSVVNIVITSAVPISYDMTMDVPQVVLHSVLASRVLFSLRESDQEEREGVAFMTSTFRPDQIHASPELD
ncbi:uncharacterized protein EDB91DRAFT_1152945 [Suillus paluster]|uniref:uncharacterized protein n=1 Tax=Suillus paluster TaxID=48578 RepID=UPI001B86326D|nr:uncharacterized protein EDB91DRAFT_1152945 [Suillus paluster]KAG1732015.1 hypothetical protein EDB91DRAFT_1152945 [Suillus paluster]